jgi:hypothetical protein
MHETNVCVILLLVEFWTPLRTPKSRYVTVKALCLASRKKNAIPCRQTQKDSSTSKSQAAPIWYQQQAGLPHDQQP